MHEREREILAFAAVHRLIVFEQVRMMLGLDGGAAAGLVEGLVDGGLLRRVRLAAGAVGFYLITAEGLAAVDSELPVPAVELVGIRHAVGIGWVWVRARERMTAEEELVTEREMRAHDATRDEPGRGGSWAGSRFGLRVGGVSSEEGGRLLYPDMVLRGRGGVTAVHLQLGFVWRERLAAVLTAYGMDPRFVAVRFLVEDEQVGREVRAAAEMVSLSGMVHVNRVEVR